MHNSQRKQRKRVGYHFESDLRLKSKPVRWSIIRFPLVNKTVHIAHIKSAKTDPSRDGTTVAVTPYAEHM